MPIIVTNQRGAKGAPAVSSTCDLHGFRVVAGRMKRADHAQPGFERDAVPSGLLNRGMMVASEGPDFNFHSGRVWRFADLGDAL